MRKIAVVLHKPIEKKWNNLEFKPRSLSTGSLAREGRAVIHTSASGILIQSLSLGRLPKHFTSKLSVQTSFITETQPFAARVRSFLTTQGNRSEKVRTRSKMTTISHRWYSKERSGEQQCPPHNRIVPIKQADFGRLTARTLLLPSGHKDEWWGCTRSPPQHHNGFWS